MIAILDCGTTNTKCYLAERDGVLLGEHYAAFGVKDNVSPECRVQYPTKLRDFVSETMSCTGCSGQSLETVAAFGMITSDLGLQELPHLPAPAGMKELREGIFRTDGSIFGEHVDFYLIRGVKNCIDEPGTPENIDDFDFMRGEETQIMGILERYHPQEAFNTIILSSHFKIIHISQEQKIMGSMTTLSGQLFDCLLHHTVVGKSVAGGPPAAVHLSQGEILDLADRILSSRGLNRAVLSPRFMEIFTGMTQQERLLYLDAVIMLEDLKAMDSFRPGGPLGARTYYIVGQEERSRLFAATLKRKYSDIHLEFICGKSGSRDLAVSGVLALIAGKY